MEQNFTEIKRRVRHYWFKDGIGEISVGGLLTALAIYFAGHRALPPVSNAPLYLDLGLAFIFILGIAFTRRLILIFKTRITYPRTGYVEYRMESVSSLPVRIGIFIAIAAFILLLIMIGRWVGSFQWVPALLGGLIGVIAFGVNKLAAGLERFVYHAVLSLVLGIGFSVSGLPPQYGLSLYYLVLGVWLIGWGGRILKKYLRENPLPERGADD
ncbi:MAG: hypothetical protein IPG44_06195 [Anaerolineales bacterium]|jgi:hypothetical protein|nr:hypothetical protein [Chloroflexota bacterium]MBK6645331.1 hypothetical protein [Anaerolineales bacterium]